MARNLLMGDLALAEGLNFALGQRLAFPQSNPGAELLAIFRIRNAEDLHVLDLWMTVEIFLDLARIDVLAAANDQVLDPSHDVAVARFVDCREIAGMHPASGIQ